MEYITYIFTVLYTGNQWIWIGLYDITHQKKKKTIITYLSIPPHSDGFVSRCSQYGCGGLARQECNCPYWPFMTFEFLDTLPILPNTSSAVPRSWYKHSITISQTRHCKVLYITLLYTFKLSLPFPDPLPFINCQHWLNWIPFYGRLYTRFLSNLPTLS